MDKYPKHAEHFIRSHFTKPTDIDSKILPGRKVAGPEICNCPRCEKPFPDAWEHGKTDRCVYCRLFMLTFGNSIYIWEHP